MAYAHTQNGKLRCTLCPHQCLIADAHTGFCRVRVNDGGELSLPFYGLLSGVSVDPIEKKPLYHYYPGSTIFSIGFFGCNFRCPFCQNYNISQTIADSSNRTSPDDVVSTAKARRSFAIAYTYSEPVVHFEYVMDTAAKAREQGLKNVLVSNGYLSPEPASELLDFMDAANIDLKGYQQDFYKQEIRGSLQPVLDFIRLAAAKVVLEVTTLVIPGKNDSPDEIREIARFLARVDRSIPLHLSCYYPSYKYVVEATDPDTVFTLADIAREELDYVYAGNVGTRETNTLCPSCGELIVRRTGYTTRVVGLTDGACSTCGRLIPIVTS